MQHCCSKCQECNQPIGILKYLTQDKTQETLKSNCLVRLMTLEDQFLFDSFKIKKANTPDSVFTSLLDTFAQSADQAVTAELPSQ